MRLEFTYTFEDLRETLMAPQTAAQRASRKRRRIVNLICWPLTILCFGFAIWASRFTLRRAWVLDGMPLDVVADVLPGVLAAAFLCLFVFLASWTAWRASRIKRPDLASNARGPVVQVIGVVFGLLIAGSAILLTRKDAILLWMPTRSERILASGGPKRAFADSAEIERCRALLQSMIAKVEFQVTPTGFEILPQRVLPLPALEPQAAQHRGSEPIVQTSQT